MAYATLADLATYTGKESSAPGDERLLQRASELVDAALASSYYLVDSSGNATDTGVIDALKRAACAQVEWWRAVDDDLGGSWQRANLGGAALALYAGGQPSGRARLCPRAQEALCVSGIWQAKPLAW